MSTFRPIRAVLLCGILSLIGVAEAAQEDPTTSVIPGMYISCQYRVAGIFPGEPMVRDFMYTNGNWTVPAREFYVPQGMNRYSVTVADFSEGGPEIDEIIVENSIEPFRERGEVRFQFPEDYTPGLPGRQLNVFYPDGHQHLVSVYMADHRLYIIETDAEPGDFAALQFEQSVVVIRADGTDMNSVSNPPRFPCAR